MAENEPLEFGDAHVDHQISQEDLDEIQNEISQIGEEGYEDVEHIDEGGGLPSAILPMQILLARGYDSDGNLIDLDDTTTSIASVGWTVDFMRFP